MCSTWCCYHILALRQQEPAASSSVGVIDLFNRVRYSFFGIFSRTLATSSVVIFRTKVSRMFSLLDWSWTMSRNGWNVLLLVLPNRMMTFQLLRIGSSSIDS